MNSFYFAIGFVVILSFAIVYGGLFLLAKFGLLLPQVNHAPEIEVAAPLLQNVISEDAIQSIVSEIIITKNRGLISMEDLVSTAINIVVPPPPRKPRIFQANEQKAGTTSHSNSYDFGLLEAA